MFLNPFVSFMPDELASLTIHSDVGSSPVNSLLERFGEASNAKRSFNYARYKANFHGSLSPAHKLFCTR